MNPLAFPRSGALLAALALSSSLATACATGSSSGAGASGAQGGSGGSGGSGAQGGGGSGGDLIGGGNTGGGGSAAAPLIYVHTNTTLYKADPSASDLAVTEIGPIECIGGDGEDTSLTDLAVSASGEIWGVSKTNIYRLEIDGASVKCTQTIPMQNPTSIRFYGLTFAPKGVLDPEKEVLIAGNTAGELWAVTETGELSLHGTLGTVPVNDGNGHDYLYPGKKWELSGDIVFVENGGNPAGFATVRDCPNPPEATGCNGIDTLVELDVAKLASATTGSVLKSLRGQIVKAAGCSDASSEGYGGVFGITAWKDKVFGFSRSDVIGGLAITIENDKGTACALKVFSQEWSGAGITTTAEIEIPPPK